MTGRFLGVLLGVALCCLSGCAAVEMSQELARQSLRMFKPRTSDYHDYNEDAADEWGFVGDEARNLHSREKDPDPWFKQRIMSAKARQIEHNVGVD